MTIEELNKLKEDTKISLYNILKYKKHRLPTTSVTKYVKVMFDNTEEDLKLLNRKIAIFKPNYIRSNTINKAYMGWTEEIGTNYTLVREEYATEINEPLVKAKTMSAVANIIRRDTNGLYYSIRPKCEVMELFKAGKISWEDVIEAHLKDCEIG